MDDLFLYLRALLRRSWTILIIFVVGSVCAAGIAYVLPPVFESTAKILVESQQIPEDLAQTTVRQSVAERLQLIEQRLMTRDNLLELVNRLSLFADREDLTPTDRVELLRANTMFQALSFETSGRGGSQVSAFTITYRAPSAGLAAKVANEFVTLVLEQNLASRSARATETYEFFRREVDRLASELLDLEVQIARYKNENSDALPDGYQFRLTELSAIEQRQFGLEQRRVQLEEQRHALSDPAGVAMTGTRRSPEEQELAQLRRTLLRKRSILAESHPEIVALRANIGALEALLMPDAADEEAENEAEEASATLVANRRQAQIDVITEELSLISEQLAEGETRSDELRESLSRTASVEMALNAYARRYQTLQTQYENAVRKLAEAETGQRLEVNQQAERFEVIEQALVPSDPVAPPRLMLAAGGAVASLALGIGLALALEMINPAIRTGSDLHRRLELRPIVGIPYIRTHGERRRRILKSFIRITLVSCAILGILWFIDQHVMPLEVLIARVMQKTGIEGFIQMLRLRL